MKSLKMKVEPIEFRREDGLAFCRWAPDRWVLRIIRGPSWFLDPELRRWHIVTLLPNDTILSFGRPLAEVKRIAAMVPDVREIDPVTTTYSWPSTALPNDGVLPSHSGGCPTIR